MKWKIVKEKPDAELTHKWNEFLENASMPTHYTTPNFMVDPFIRGGERFAVLAFDKDDAITGVLTGVFNGKRIKSGMPVRPQTAFRDDADLGETALALFEGMKEHGGRSLQFIEFYTWNQ